MSGTIDPNANVSTLANLAAGLIVTGPATGVTVAEDGANGAFDRAALLANATDADAAATLDIQVDDLTLPPGVVYNHVPGFTTVSTIGYYGFSQIITVPTVDTLTIDPSNAAYQSLAAGETLDVVVNYTITDGTNSVPAQAIFHIVGTNDAPVVSEPIVGSALQGDAPVTISGIGNATDVDHGAVLSVVAAPPPAPEAQSFVNAAGVAEGAAPPSPPVLPFDPATLPSGVTFDAATNTFSFDPSNAAYQGLTRGQTATVTVNYGVSDGTVATAASLVFTVTGVEHAPTVSGPVTGVFVNDGGAAASYNLQTLLSTAHDVDPGDKLTVVIDPNNLPAGVSFVTTPEHFVAGHVIAAHVIQAGPRATPWGNYVYPTTFVPAVTVPDEIVAATTVLSLDPSNAVYKSLAQGEELDVVVNYQVSDGTESVAAQAIFTVNGINDAPVVIGPVTAGATEDAAVVTVNALANATDVDHGSILTVVAPLQPAVPPPGTVAPGDTEAENEFLAAVAGTAVASQAFDPSTLPAGVTFDAATNRFSIDPSNAAYQYLAQGQTTTVTVNYGISDGIVATAASVVFTITGTNDAPVVTGPAETFVTEDGTLGLFNHAALVAHASDVDLADKLDIQIDDASLPAGVVYNHVPGFITTVGVSTTYYGAITSFVDVQVAPVDTLTLDPSNAAYQSLAAGETEDVVVTYRVTDGIASAAAQAVFHITGVNDAPVVAGAVTAAATEDGAAVTANALANATDVDHGSVLSVVAAPPPPPAVEANFSPAGINETAALPPSPILPFDATSLPAGVTFDAATNSFTIDASNAAYQSLAQGGTETVTVRYGVTDGMVNTAASLNFVVTGTNDAPVVSGPVTLLAVARTVPPPAPVSLTSPLDKTAAGIADVLPPWIDAVTGAGVPLAQAAHSVLLLANATDVDRGTTLSVVGLPSVLPAGISHIVTAPFTTPSDVYYGAPIVHPGVDALVIDPSDPSFSSLAEGEVQTITVNYGVSDGIATTPASAVFTIVGTNDAPVVSGAVLGTATEDGAAVTLNGLASATDVDHGSVLNVVNVPATLPAGVTFDAATNTFTIDPSNAAYQPLALGQRTSVTVNYGVSDGMVTTAASAVFTVVGTNDAPVVSGPLSVGVTAVAPGATAAVTVTTLVTSDGHGGVHDALSVSAEASAASLGLTAAQISNSVDMLANASDIDVGDVLSIVGLTASLPAGISHIQTPGYYTPSPVYYGAPVYHHGFDLLTIDPSNPAFRSLAAGETQTIVVNYGITDGHATTAASASFTITGVNDAPVVPNPVATATEDGAKVTINLMSTASDPDHGSVISLASVQTVLPAGITYNAATQTVSLDPTNAAFQSLAQGQTGTYSVGFSVTDGQLVTPASAIFSVVGVNDAPVIVAPMMGTANEGGALANIDPLANVTDVDTPIESLRVVGIPSVLPAGVSFNAVTQKFFLDPTNAAYQYLSLNETTTVRIPFGISDGYATVPATAVFTITGRNNAPTVTGAVAGGTTTGQGAPVTLNLIGNASDVDHLDVLNVSTGAGATVTATVTSGTWTAPVSFTVTNNRLTIDPKQFASLGVGKTVGLSFNYQVTDGNPGGSVADSATLTIQGTNAGPSGVTIGDVTSSLAKAQSGSGINAKVAIATFAQTGGVATDAYSYTLSGTGAAPFTLGTSAGVATLSVGASPAVGAAGGKLYTLNVIATDTTAGISAAPTSVDVVIGLGSGSGTINLTSLTGMAPPTPTFIFDLGGSDKINAAGMTGTLWIDGGQGADTMTGGSGANNYLYGATTDSTQTLMDIVNNFHTATDLLDLTGLGTRFTSVGALSSTATTIGASAIGWQTSGGNTFVYVNTSSNSAGLSSAAMKIELMGVVPLGAGNIAHL